MRKYRPPKDAVGATGSVAGQIARNQDRRVIGTAGGKDKCDWLVNEAHFDAAIDYKSEDVGARADCNGWLTLTDINRTACERPLCARSSHSK